MRASWATSRRAAMLLVATGLAAAGCSKKEEKTIDVPDIPMKEGRATSQELLTTIGAAKGLEASLASTAMRWTRVVGDGERILLGGWHANEAVALVSDNGARNWKALRAPAPDQATWSTGKDGTIVLSLVRRAKPKRPLPKGEVAPIEALALIFAAPGGELETKIPLVEPTPEGAKGVRPPAAPTIPFGEGVAAVVAPDAASFVIDTAPRRPEIVFVPKSGTTLPPPLPFPAGEKPVYAPWGRPPVLLTLGPRGLLRRPWPKPGEALAKAEPIAGVSPSPTLQAELSAGPECEAGAFSYRRVGQSGGRLFVLGVSPDKSVFFEVPQSTVAESPLGCGGGRVVVEALDPRDKIAKLVACAENGCIAPENTPFRVWAEKHDRTLAIASTTKSVVAMAGFYSPLRWGLFETQSSDGGKLWDPQRIMGEGPGERGRYDLGALVPMDDKVLALVAADVTGTNRRSWFAMASTDGGLTWNVP